MEEGKEVEEGAAGPKSEARLVIVPASVCCQLWQWNMISPPPLLLLTNHGESLERWGREMQCKGSTSEVVSVVWGMGRDGRGGAAKRSVPLGS